jgi:hypothetical protein
MRKDLHTWKIPANSVCCRYSKLSWLALEAGWTAIFPENEKKCGFYKPYFENTGRRVLFQKTNRSILAC